MLKIKTMHVRDMACDSWFIKGIGFESRVVHITNSSENVPFTQTISQRGSRDYNITSTLVDHQIEYKNNRALIENKRINSKLL